jgi:hypothetical protein
MGRAKASFHTAGYGICAGYSIGGMDIPSHSIPFQTQWNLRYGMEYPNGFLYIDLNLIKSLDLNRLDIEF